MAEVLIKNKKASFEYEFIDKFIAGIILAGTEIKSVRQSKVSLKEAYCIIQRGECFIRNMHIAEYKQASYNNHEPKRERKLLLNAQEIGKIEKKLKDQGITLIPLKMFISKSGYAKIEIALAKGKKLHDKRESLKEKESKRVIDRKLKSFG